MLGRLTEPVFLKISKKGFTYTRAPIAIKIEEFKQNIHPYIYSRKMHMSYTMRNPPFNSMKTRGNGAQVAFKQPVENLCSFKKILPIIFFQGFKLMGPLSMMKDGG